MSSNGITTQAGAEEVALKALAWIAAQEDALGALLAASGLAPTELRDRAADPEFLGFVLDFLMQDEAMLCAFAAAAGVAPDAPMRVRAALPGGQAPHWT